MTTPMKYMVAVDGSPDCEEALLMAFHLMNKKTDELYLMCVTEKLGSQFPVSPAFYATLATTQQELEKESETLIRQYGKKCKQHGVHNVFGVRGTSPHVGEMICQAVEKKEIDVLVIGRRGMNKLKRFVLGSVSKYCLEHADCSVLVHKQSQAQKLRLQEQKDQEKKEKVESDLNRNVSRMAEEEEKLRLAKEQKEVEEKEHKEREAAHIGAVIAEEEERKRRIEEDRIIENRTFHVEQVHYEAMP